MVIPDSEKKGKNDLNNAFYVNKLTFSFINNWILTSLIFFYRISNIFIEKLGVFNKKMHIRTFSRLDFKCKLNYYVL